MFRTVGEYKSNMRPAPAGSKYENEYTPQYDKNGHRELLVTGKTNIYEQTQADAQSVSIEYILEQCTLSGDYSRLDNQIAQYIDTTEMPENLIEAQNTIIRAKSDFERLPLEIRSKYNHSFEEYLADMGTENWAKNLGFIKEEKEVQPIKKEELAKEIKADE